ncbi:hypothetical protein [Bordetella sp. BOR01]|uniref:hypothetical protein n=1 Tax=Bordetella sp. BOR01 TaxID=2854779 RepID=UPI001C47F619|nr:hypothetical protein [Bordetella sp. BOR01]MBV7482921.1 hypothetical protein [Bordetella sp. BOR01]
MKILAILSLALFAAGAHAALPEPDAAAQAKAAEAKAKTAWTAQVAAFQLCSVQDRVAAAFFESARAAGRTPAPPIPTPECQDPGPFAYAPVADQSREDSGAHSPAETASQPPSSAQPEADKKPAK